MADEEGSEDTLLDSILEEEGEEQEQGQPESEEDESAEQEGGEQESEEESDQQETEAEGGEGPDDADESEEGEEDQGERARPSRGQSRIQRLNEERNRLRAENEELRRRAGGGGGQGGGGNVQPQGQTPQQFRETLKKGVQEKLGPDFALLQPDQQADRLMGAMETMLQPIVRGLQGNQFASNDRAQFYEDRAGNRWVQRNKGEIERRFQAALAQGFTVPREQIARDMAGEQALTGIQKGGGSARRQAKNRKEAARGTPTRGRGDTSGRSRKSDMEQLEERLKDVKI